MSTENGSYIGSPDNYKTTSVVAYITFIGWLIAYFALYRNNRNSYSAFHLRQALLVHIISFLLKVIYSFTLLSELIFFIAVVVLSTGLFILWLMGFVDALNGKERPIPIIGKFAQSIFSRL